ncbi:MAG: amino acid permease [Nitrososphaerota archaeon]|nr:amino acid permease [Nitrososphaerota archaeon]
MSGSQERLPRQMGLFQVVTYGIGNIVGAGIYVLVGDAAGLAGTSVWISFLIGAVVAAFTGLTYAELTSMYPRAASEYVYIGRAYGSRHLSFVTEWTMLVTEVVAASAVSIGFAGYLQAILGTPVLPVAAILLLVLSLIALAGSSYWLRLNTILSIIAIAGLAIVIVSGLGGHEPISYAPPQGGFSGILAAAILVFFAYIGFDNISNIAEDAKEPEKVVPRGLVIAVIVTTVLYVLVGITAVGLVEPSRLSSSDAPLALAASVVLGRYGFYLLSFIALMTTMNTVQVLIIVSSRIVYGMAREKALPAQLGYVNKRTKSPVLAILMVLLISMIFLPLSSASAIAKVTSFGSLVTFSLVNIALLHLRRTAPNIRRPFKAPLSVGWFSVTAGLGLAFCLALLFQFDPLSIVLGLILPVSGVLIYLLFSRKFSLSTDRELHEPHVNKK